MAVRIKFTLRVVTDNKTAAIKALRTASGLGLKESKDIIDACVSDFNPGLVYPKQVIMTEAQFGRLVAESIKLPDADRACDGPLFTFTKVEILQDEPFLDLTNV